MNEMAICNTPPLPVRIAPVTPMDLLQQAVSSGADIDKLAKLMDLQERFEANEARKAYVQAMAAFKANPPDILKDAKVRYGNTEYDHATLAHVTNTINQELSRHGLSSAWRTDQGEKTVTVTCSITHVMGHSESTSLSAAPDTSGSKNSIQAIGSTITYLQRYTLLALTGLAARDQDDDGAGSEEPKFITDDQQANIIALITEVGADMVGFMKFFKLADLDHMPAVAYPKAINMLEAKRGKP